MTRHILALSCALAALSGGVGLAQQVPSKDAVVNPLATSMPTFKAKVGDYPGAHYAPPSAPIPYDQLDAYLKSGPNRQAARARTGAPAATPSSGNVSATTSTAPASRALPGDTDVGLRADTAKPTENGDKAPSTDTAVNPPNPTAPSPTAPL